MTVQEKGWFIVLPGESGPINTTAFIVIAAIVRSYVRIRRVVSSTVPVEVDHITADVPPPRFQSTFCSFGNAQRAAPCNAVAIVGCTGNSQRSPQFLMIRTTIGWRLTSRSLIPR